MKDKTAPVDTPAPTGAATETVATAPTLDLWQQRIQPFSEAVKKPAGDVNTALAGLVGEPGNEAALILADNANITDEDLTLALVKDGPKIPLGLFRKHLHLLRGPRPVTASPADRAVGAAFKILPAVPDDTSFLELLKIGGVLKPGVTEVMAAVKAALADKAGLYDLTDKILEKMEEFAEAQEEAVGAKFYELRKVVASRSYGEILEVLNVPGSFVTETRRQAFLAKINALLWSELSSFNTRLVSWQELCVKGFTNPGMAINMIAMMQGGRGGMVPPGMMQPPETASLRDAAEAVVNRINKVFAGFGIPVARALAYDAARIKTALEDPALPATMGATNREMMIKMLGAQVTADDVRLEKAITGFTLAIIKLHEVTPGTEEYAYLGAMIELSSSIPWDKLPSESVGRAGLGKPARTAGRLAYREDAEERG